MVSNGEYMPCPQTEDQKRVEARIKQLADAASKKLGISRRKFLAGAGGIAASFVAMNEVFGRFFKVNPEEIFEPAGAAESAAPKDLFVFDDQTHLVRGSKNGGALVGALRAIAQGPTTPGFTSNPFNAPPNVVGLDEFGGAWTPWNPALIDQPLPQDVFDVLHYVKSFFFGGGPEQRAGVHLRRHRTAAGEHYTVRSWRDSHSRADRRRQEFRQPDCRIHPNDGARHPSARRQGFAESGLHTVPERRAETRLVEGIQHHELGQGRSRSEQRHEDVAA